MPLNPKDMRRKINASLRGKSEAERILIIDGLVRDCPPNVRSEYAEMRRHLLRRLEKLQTAQQVKASSARSSADPFVIPKTGHLTAVLVGLPNTGKSLLFQRLGGDGANVADYPFSTATPAVHLAVLDNLRLQLVDLPPITQRTVETLPYGSKLSALVKSAHVICVVLDLSDDVEHQEQTITEELGSFGIDNEARPLLVLGTKVSANYAPHGVTALFDNLTTSCLLLNSEDAYQSVLPQIARSGGYQSVFAKPPGQSPEQADRMWLEIGATVKDLASAVHKALARRINGARVWGDSSGQPGQTVSINHLLSDGDVVELQYRRHASSPP